MGLKLLVLCLIRQIFISAAFGELVLPFTELVAIATPLQPKSLSTSDLQLPSISDVPYLTEKVLEYYTLLFPEDNGTSQITPGFSSPLIVTSVSRPLPLSKIKSTNTLDPCPQHLPELSTIQCESDVLAADIPFYPCPANILNQVSLPVVPQLNLQQYSGGMNLYHNVFPQCRQESIGLNPLFQNYPPDNLLPLSKEINIVPPISVLPSVCLQRLPGTTNNLLPTPKYHNPLPLCSPATVIIRPHPPFFPIHPSVNLFSLESLPPIDPIYSLPYPLRYEQLSLPEVVTPPNLEPSNFKEGHYPEIYTNIPEQFQHQCTNPLSPFVTTPFIPFTNTPKIIPQPYPRLNLVPKIPIIPLQPDNCISKYTNCPYLVSLYTDTPMETKIDDFFTEFPDDELDYFEFLTDTPTCQSVPYSVDDLYSYIEYTGNYDAPDIFTPIDNFVDTLEYDIENRIHLRNVQASIDTYSTIPELPECIPDFTPIQKICIDDAVTEIPLAPLISDISLPQTSVMRIVPPTYLTVAPSYPLCESSSKAIPAVNEMVSNIAQNIVSHFTSYIKAASEKAKYKFKCNPFTTAPRKQNIYACPTLRPLSTPNNPMCSTYTPTVPNEAVNIPINMPYLRSQRSLIPTSFLNTICNDPTVYDEDFSLLYSDTSIHSLDLSLEAMEMSSSTPAGITVLPPVSFSDYSPQQPCPSYLPSPIIPSNLNITLPVVVELPIVKVKSLSKKPKTLEKLLELIFIAELLNDDEGVDWDAIDTVLKLLRAK